MCQGTGRISGIVVYCIALYCIVLYCIVLYCIVLYCIVLYCTVLYCIVFFFFHSNFYQYFVLVPLNSGLLQTTRND